MSSRHLTIKINKFDNLHKSMTWAAAVKTAIEYSLQWNVMHGGASKVKQVVSLIEIYDNWSLRPQASYGHALQLYRVLKHKFVNSLAELSVAFLF